MRVTTFYFIILFISLAIFSGCASRDTRLEGSWRSNKKLTVATMENLTLASGKKLSARKRQLLASIFGKLIVTYDHRTVICQMPSPKGGPPSRNTSPYRIVASDRGSLVYVSNSLLTGEPTINHVYFEGPDRYWIYLHRTSMKEYFDRISPSPANSNRPR